MLQNLPFSPASPDPLSPREISMRVFDLLDKSLREDELKFASAMALSIGDSSSKSDEKVNEGGIEAPRETETFSEGDRDQVRGSMIDFMVGSLFE